MGDEEILEKLLQFGEYLSKGTIIKDTFRWILWMITKGLAWIVDALENVTETILGLKSFYKYPEFVDFIQSFQPILVILFALNILYIGYLLIFQNKLNREGIITNLIMALMIIVLLGTGMQKADRFTTDAIDAIGDTDATDTVASNVITDNIHDVALFDINGWETPELENKNKIDGDYVTDIDINSYLTEGSEITADKELSKKGEDILSHKVGTLGDGTRKVMELEDGNWITDITKEYYYRYTLDWFNMIATLLIMAFVLITIAVKLAKLFFELAFNYALAGLVAPTDMHSGQKMKQVIQNIVSIFVVTILIFLSMKVYMIGTEWIGENFDGLVYLVAMLGFAMAVIDGPNIVERLFGIDAGMKSGWGAIAGTYAMARGAGSVAKGVGKGAKTATGAAGSAVSKTGGAMGGMAGVASGLSGGDKQSVSQNANGSKEQNQKQGAQGAGKGSAQSENAQSSDSNTSQQEVAATSENNQSEQNNKGNNGSNQDSNSTPSIHDEMQTKNEQGGQQSSKPSSLHNEMQRKGFTGGSSTDGTSNSGNNSSVNVGGSSPSAPTPSGGGSPDAGGSSPSAPTPSGGGSPDAGGSSPSAPTPSSGGSPDAGGSSSSAPTPSSGGSPDAGGSENHEVHENRHVGQVTRDKVKQKATNTKTANNVKKGYQIGRNTGASIKKNVKKRFRK